MSDLLFSIAILFVIVFGVTLLAAFPELSNYSSDVARVADAIAASAFGAQVLMLAFMATRAAYIVALLYKAYKMYNEGRRKMIS